jgi:peptidoglycan/LPS O-acetylase OafA/YrhL
VVRYLRCGTAAAADSALVVVADVEHQRHLWPWLASFATDIYTFFHTNGIRSVAPLWSLTVQEQFYLVWPWLLFFLPRRWLVPLLVTFFFAAPVCRLVASFRFDAHMLPQSYATIQVLPTSVVDSLAVGALVVLARRDELHNSRFLRRVAAVGGGHLCMDGDAGSTRNIQARQQQRLA